MGVRWKWFCGLVFLGVGAWPAQGGEFRVPLMSQLPRLDGQVKPQEWAVSVGFDGFAWQGELERRQVRAFVGATGTHLYFAFRFSGELLYLPLRGQSGAGPVLVRRERLRLELAAAEAQPGTGSHWQEAHPPGSPD